MNEPKSWIVFYRDGSTFTDGDGPPENAPAFDVEAVVGLDGTWLGGDLVGLITYLCIRKPPKIVVICGSHIPNWRYGPIVAAARKYVDLYKNWAVIEKCDYYWWEGDFSP